MKIYTSFISFTVISIFSVSSMHSMDRQATIAAHQEKKLMRFLQQDFTPINAQASITRFESKLQAFKERIQVHEESLHENIKREFSISDALWNDVDTVTYCAKATEQAALHLPLEGVVHDEKMPPYIKQMFTSLLEQKGINPKRINLLYNIQGRDGTEVLPEASNYRVRSSFPHWHQEGLKVIFDDVSTPGEIELLQVPRLLSQQEALCTILVEVIAQQFSLREINLLALAKTANIRKTVTQYSTHHTAFGMGQTISTKTVQFEDGEPFKEIGGHKAYIASVHAALLNQNVAHLMYEHWSNTRTEGLNADDLFRYITWYAKIKRYWDSIAWLKQYAWQ